MVFLIYYLVQGFMVSSSFSVDTHYKLCRLSREMAHDEGSGANESGMEKRNRKRKKLDVHAETVCEV